ncbi:nuclear transport factor 2 family protein [Corynebacterium liangguodongii]|uniref:Uncharacterized protein n=1 Tax=Corynebacterium liangguodongii TaxID=2079535 RepID=A0A2S0WEZ5_9CORY|nr:nuclear transport factor 2 family protein [Corynebacterium liangguodongii]AWB84320.1 hypothetical protein C3E79_07365 [Corynebacterium liangguodongii]PWB99810.1 nuclear transport factor 2 family protein [Corynebacterium liangguodongii]
MKMLYRSARASVLAATVATAAAALAACGANEETPEVVEATATETATHKAAPAAPAEPSPSASESGAAASSPAPGADPKAPGAAAAPGAQPLTNPFEDPNFTPPEAEPLNTGGAGTDEDKAQMEKALHDSLNPASPELWTRALLDNTCHKIADPARAEMERSGYSLEQIEQAARMQAQAGQAMTLPESKVSLSDVRVDGNRASANATVTSDAGTDTQVQIFEREDGRWKMCN